MYSHQQKFCRPFGQSETNESYVVDSGVIFLATDDALGCGRLRGVRRRPEAEGEGVGRAGEVEEATELLVLTVSVSVSWLALPGPGITWPSLAWLGSGNNHVNWLTLPPIQ